MITLLLILILIVLGFIAVALNRKFGELIKSIFNLSLGIGALLLFLVIIGLIIWGGYHLLTKYSDSFLGALYFIMLLLLLYSVVVWPILKGQNFLKKNGLVKSEYPKIIKAIIFIAGVIFVVLFSLLLDRLGL